MAEQIYAGYDNVIKLQLKENGAVVNLTDAGVSPRAVTKVALLFKEQIIDSDNYPSSFDWVTDGLTGIVSINIGNITGLETGIDENAELIVYDPAHTNGIVWGTFSLTNTSLEGTVVT